MSTKYTPAPWRVHHSHGWLVVEDDNEEMFVQVKKGIGSEKDRANAYLIAAAPELLEALQNLANIMIAFEDDGSKHVFQSAKSAISKALGE